MSSFLEPKSDCDYCYNGTVCVCMCVCVFPLQKSALGKVQAGQSLYVI